MTKVDYYLRIRDDALASGDMGVARAITSDLRRWGVSEDAAQAPVPRRGRGRGRPPKARCEHERIAERCELCNPDLEAA